MTRDDLERALDNPLYPSRRIGFPLLAHCFGLGKPAWILQVYAFLNVVFCLLLLAEVDPYIGFQRPSDVLLAIALLISTGTLTSIERSLIPTFLRQCWGGMSLCYGRMWITSAFLPGSAALFKETLALSFVVACWIEKGKRLDIKHILVTVLIMIIPIALWLVYVQVLMTGGNNAGINNFAFPLSGIVHKLWKAIHDCARVFPRGPVYGQAFFAFELLGPLSLVVQATYLIVKPSLDDEVWRLGIGFVLLLCLLGDIIWVEQNGYCRTLLPLTFSFNLLVHKHELGMRFGMVRDGQCGYVLEVS